MVRRRSIFDQIDRVYTLTESQNLEEAERFYMRLMNRSLILKKIAVSAAYCWTAFSFMSRPPG
ncbi:hypothetical protein CS542_05240 [Pedobacter sp. IW39]|nr:hypothetical protein CS542_05240 [Pedobacter sp. IW39]